MQKKLFYLEIILALLALVGFILRIQQLDFGQLLLVGGCSLLSFLYLVKAILSWNNRPAKTSAIVAILVLLDCAVAVQALGFKLGLLEGSEFYFRTALYTFLGLVLILLVNLWIAETTEIFEFYRRLLVRSLVVIALSFLFFITPYTKLIKLYYKNRPEEAQKLIQKLDPPKSKRRIEINF